MEPLPVQPVDVKRPTPWGVIIGIILILAIVVFGAYYSFTKRFQLHSSATSSQQ